MFDSFAEDRFFKNIIINLIFSVLALLSFYAKLCLMAAEAIGGLEFLLIFACEAGFCVFSAIYACFMLKRVPTSFSRLSLLAGAWSVLLFAKDMAVFYVGKSFVVSRGLLFAISGILFAALFAFMLLSLCKKICDFNKPIVWGERKKLRSFFSVFVWGVVSFVVVSLFSVGFVNSRGNRMRLVIVREEITKRWEPRLFALVLLLFLPYYATAFIQFFKDIAEEQEQKEEQ